MNTSLPIVDTHTDLVLSYQQLKNNFDKNTENTQTSLPLLKGANIKLLFAGFSYDDALNDSDKQLKNINKMLKKFAIDFELVTNFNNIEKLFSSSKIGVIIHLEGAKILNNKISNLVKLHKKGLLSLGLTHNTKNGLATGAAINNNHGLTNFGKRVIKKCNELNIILDLSHLNEKGFYEAIALSKKPVIVSHANCYKITPHPRNLKDEQLKKITEINSVVGVFFSGKFLNPKMNALQSSIDDALLHIEHMIKVMGINHIAIGSDFGGITTGTPKGLENHQRLVLLFKKLKDKGYSTEDIEKIAYKNILRVLQNYKV